MPDDGRRHFRLEDYSDRELVALIDDLADANTGWTHASDIAHRLGFTGKEVASVSIRLAWMRRYGIVSKNEETPAGWKLTPDGRAMLNGARTAAEKTKQLQGLKPGELVHVSHAIASRFQRASDAHASMTRREWQREFKLRRR